MAKTYPIIKAVSDQIKNATTAASNTAAIVGGNLGDILDKVQEVDLAKVPTTRKVNSKALSADIALDKTDVGLGNVDNTADADKPVSDATNTFVTNHTNRTDNPHTVTKTQVGLSNVDNTSDADKPISNAVDTALDLKADLIDGKVPVGQLPAYVDDVLEYANFAAFPVMGESGKIYVALDTNLTYRWGGSAYTEISKSLALGETSTTAYRGDRGKMAYDHSQLTGNAHGTTAAQIANTPAGTIAATTVQAAINELDSDRVQLETDLNDYKFNTYSEKRIIPATSAYLIEIKQPLPIGTYQLKLLSYSGLYLTSFYVKGVRANATEVTLSSSILVGGTTAFTTTEEFPSIKLVFLKSQTELASLSYQLIYYSDLQYLSGLRKGSRIALKGGNNLPNVDTTTGTISFDASSSFVINGVFYSLGSTSYLNIPIKSSGSTNLLIFNTNTGVISSQVYNYLFTEFDVLIGAFKTNAGDTYTSFVNAVFPFEITINGFTSKCYAQRINDLESSTTSLKDTQTILNTFYDVNSILIITKSNGSIPLGSVGIGGTVNYTPDTGATYSNSIKDCVQGDKFTISGTGGDNPRLWAFVDVNDIIITMSVVYATATNLQLTAPNNARKLIVNYKNGAGSAYKGIDTTTKRIDSLEKTEYITEIPDDINTSFIRGIKFADELKAPLSDFKKNGDLMVHVSSFCIISDVAYMTYYANTISAEENPAQHIARFVYAPLSNLNSKTFIDLCNIGDIIDGKTVTKIYDIILLKKDDSTIYLMWTAALNGVYYRVYKTFDVASATVSSSVYINNFIVGSNTQQFSTTGMNAAFTSNNILHKTLDGDIGIMQKLSTRVEGGVTFYYTGCYVGPFNCIIKSSDLINWYFVSQPDFPNDSQFENAVYVVGNKAYYFCRQYSELSKYGFLTYYDLTSNQWSYPVMVYDAQSRSDFFEYGGNLYLVHAPKDRNHISIMKIDQTCLNRSYEIQVAKIFDSFYPYTQIYNNEFYMSFTTSRLHIYLSKFTLNSIPDDTILNKFKTLFADII